MAQVFLDHLSLRDARLAPQFYQGLLDYYWDHYSYFAHQRSLRFSELKNSLASNCQPFSFSQWQRIVTPIQFRSATLGIRALWHSDEIGEAQERVKEERSELLRASSP